MRIGLTSIFVADQDQAERFRAGGVVFVKEPSRRDYGGTDAVFADSCGNLLNLHQD
jgi:predicted enzyme related to lactoylglutathione lyase